MKITREKNLVEIVPETDAETTSLLALYNSLTDCVGFNKKLVPTGEFVPSKEKVARFTVEE